MKDSLSPPPAPPAPPLPPQQASAKIERESPYLEKLRSAPPDYLTNIPPSEYATALPPRKPTYYFFYGTLAQPEILKRIIGLDAEEEPVLREARVYGYALAKWGDYRTLINGEQGQIVSGYAYLVKTQEHEDKLAYYETNAYKVAPCRIEFTDGLAGPEELSGKTFMYAGDPKALLEKRFDRKLWVHQMRQDLPLNFGQQST